MICKLNAVLILSSLLAQINCGGVQLEKVRKSAPLKCFIHFIFQGGGRIGRRDSESFRQESQVGQRRRRFQQTNERRGEEESHQAAYRFVFPFYSVECSFLCHSRLISFSFKLFPSLPLSLSPSGILILYMPRAERIPTAKEELFGFSLEWTMVDSTLMEKRIKPWINKKIIEYIGEEEQSLVEYICQKVRDGIDATLVVSSV